MEPLDEGQEGLLLDVKLDSVVSGRDGLDVPVDVLVLLDALYILKERQCKEVDEDCPAGDSQPHDLPPHHLRRWVKARRLHEEVRILVALTLLAFA